MPAITIGHYTVDLAGRTAHRTEDPGQEVHLTRTEWQVLDVLVSNPGKLLSQRQLLQAVWGPDYGDQVDYLRAFIKSLRKKIEPDPDHPQYITTEPWIGYRFNGMPVALP